MAAHGQILIKIEIRPVFPAQILPGGVLRKDIPVRIDVIEHHGEIPAHTVKVKIISRLLPQRKHSVIDNGVVIAGGALGIFAVLIAVDPLRKILPGPGTQAFRKRFLLCKQVRPLQKGGGNGPAVVRRVEAAVPDGRQGPPQDPAKAIPQFLQFRPRGPRARHQPVTGDQALEAEGGVRRGMKIAGGIVKAPVVPLGALHKGGRQFHGAQQLSRFKMGAAGVQIGCQRSGKRINGRFCLPDVPAYSAILEGIRVQNLRLQKRFCAAIRPFAQVLQISLHGNSSSVCLPSFRK